MTDTNDPLDYLSTIQPSRRAQQRATGRPRLTLTIAYHYDLDRVGEEHRLDLGSQLEVGRGAPLFQPTGGGEKRPLRDPFVSRKPVVIQRTPTGLTVSVQGTTTTVRMNGHEVSDKASVDGRELESGVVLTLSDRLVLVVTESLERIPGPTFQLVGASEAMRRLRSEIALAAQNQLPVLLLGETGTGKELVARAIHRESPRRSGPYVAVNMAAIPSATAASQLFGHAKGAFTGAESEHNGYFQAAHGGTLFLDELGETPVDLQPMLLRVLETGDVQTVGATRTRRVDVRLVSATDSAIDRDDNASAFRRPLYHRLAALKLRIPALRERRADIGRLAVHFLREAVDQKERLRMERLRMEPTDRSPWLPAWLFERWLLSHWAGNVRELRNAVSSVGVLALNTTLDPNDPQWHFEAAPPPTADRSAAAPKREPDAPDEAPREERLLVALEANSWDLAAAARELGVARSTLYQWVERSDSVRKASEIPEDEVRAAQAHSDGDLDVAARRLRVSRAALQRRLRALGIEY